MENNYEKGEHLAYQELGRFLTNFEKTVFTFKQNIALILKENGLKGEHFSNIILARLTAEPIRQMFESMLPHGYNPEKQAFLKLAINRFRELTELRNIIIHCYWIITADLFDEESVSMMGIKHKTSQKGISQYNLTMEVEDMKRLNVVVEEFLELCCGITNKLKRKEENFNQINDDLHKINFKLFKAQFERPN